MPLFSAILGDRVVVTAEAGDTRLGDARQRRHIELALDLRILVALCPVVDVSPVAVEDQLTVLERLFGPSPPAR